MKVLRNPNDNYEQFTSKVLQYIPYLHQINT